MLTTITGNKKKTASASYCQLRYWRQITYMVHFEIYKSMSLYCLFFPGFKLLVTLNIRQVKFSYKFRRSKFIICLKSVNFLQRNFGRFTKMSFINSAKTLLSACCHVLFYHFICNDSFILYQKDCIVSRLGTLKMK